ncbi:nucleotidyltransferase substrate binding protein [bacterium]
MEQIKWKNRYRNFEKAFVQLTTAVKKDDVDEVVQAGIIQIFEFTFELAWKTLKDYLEFYGFKVPSPRDTIKQAYKEEYIGDGEIWLDALEKRNLMAHTYSEHDAKLAVELIKEKYFIVIKELYVFLKKEYKT